MPSTRAAVCEVLTALFALALPAAALAAPVTVVTHSTGTAYVYPTVLFALGLEEFPEEEFLPYELTLTSTFDWNAPLPARDEGAWNYGAVAVDFRMGDLHYQYAGTETSHVNLYTPSYLGGDAYLQDVSANPNGSSYGYSFDFSHMLHSPAGSMGPGGALTPMAFGGNGNENSSMGITTYYINDEFIFSWRMRGDVDTYSVQVTSAVPEPAAYGLLVAGTLTLALRRRAGRASA